MKDIIKVLGGISEIYILFNWMYMKVKYKEWSLALTFTLTAFAVVMTVILYAVD